MEIGFAAIVALWALSRSGFTSRTVYPVVINNPADLLSEGYIGEQGSINQPVYGKMKVGFKAPKAKLCYSSRISKDGVRRYQVWHIEGTEPRAIIKIPAGYKGAGTEYNITNWITQNMGEGYYVMINALKEGRGGRESYSNFTGTPAEKTALTQRAIGVSWVKYETAQRYVKHQNKMTAKEQMDELIDNWDSTYQPDDPTPPTPEPTPEPPTLPPIDPTPPTPLPPTGGNDPIDPTPPVDPTPIDPVDPFNPQPVGGNNNGGFIGNAGNSGGLMGGY